MGFLSSAFDAVKSIPGKLVGGVIDIGADFLGNELIGKPNAASAYGMSQEAYEKQYANYKRRYQDTMADMKLAGLNPILAAGSGGFNVGQTPQFTNVGHMPGYQNVGASSAYRSLMQGDKEIEAKKTERKKQLKMLAETKKIIVETSNERLKSGVIKQKERILITQIGESLARTGKIFHEVQKIGAEKETSEALKKKLVSQCKLLEQQLKQLTKVSDAYKGAYGTGLGYIRATLGAIGALLGPVVNTIK